MPELRPATSAEVLVTYSRSAQVPLSEPNLLKVSVTYLAVCNSGVYIYIYIMQNTMVLDRGEEGGGGGDVCSVKK